MRLTSFQCLFLSIICIISTPIRGHFTCVLTGGPGVGKTTIIQLLSEMNYETIPEIYAILFAKAEQEKTLESFFANPVHLYIKLLDDQIFAEAEKCNSTLLFLDRSTIDILAFAQYFQVPLSQDFISRASRNYDLIFILDPIDSQYYKNTRARKETQQEALLIHCLIEDTYRACGYTQMQLIKVPADTPNNRLLFIIEKITSIRNC